MSRARVLVATVLLLLMGGEQLRTCAGWAASADARMACCEQRSPHEEPALADTCCAGGEQRQNAMANGYACAMPELVAVSAWLAPHMEAAFLAPNPVVPASSPAFHRNAVLLI